MKSKPDFSICHSQDGKLVIHLEIEDKTWRRLLIFVSGSVITSLVVWLIKAVAAH